MCARIYIPQPDDLSDELLHTLLEAAGPEASPDGLPQGQLRPGDSLCVLCTEHGLLPSASMMKWGFSREKKLVFNARSETAGQLSFFSDSFLRRRCVIPAAGYFEWDHREKKPPKYRFSPINGDVLYLAGLYRFEEGRPVFTVLTRPAAPMLRCFHDRMPVLLHEEELQAWLDPQNDPLPILRHPMTELIWTKAS